MAACNAIFLLLVVSLLYKGSICDEQQLEALEKKLQVLEQKLLDMENKQHTESRKLHRTIENVNQVTNQQHQCEQKLEKESMKLHQTIAAVDEVKAENQNSFEELGVTKALFLQAMEKVDDVSEKVGQVDSKVNKLGTQSVLQAIQKVDEVSEQLGKVDRKVDEVDGKVKEVDSKVEEVKQEVDKPSTIVAFTATMTETFGPKLITRGGWFGVDEYEPIPEASPLPFNSVQVNIGNAYNRYTYKFTCPVSGMYYFSFSVFSGHIQRGTVAYESKAYIYHGSHRVAGGYSGTHVRVSEIEVQTAASAVIRCDVGDEVEVRPGGTSGNTFYGSSSKPLSTFTGFLITPQ